MTSWEMPISAVQGLPKPSTMFDPLEQSHAGKAADTSIGSTFSCAYESCRVCEVNHLTILLISSTRFAHDKSRFQDLWVGSPAGSQPTVIRTTGASKFSLACCLTSCLRKDSRVLFLSAQGERRS